MGICQAKPRIELGGLERDVDLRAVADVVELDPVGVRQHRAGSAPPRPATAAACPPCPRRSGRGSRSRPSVQSDCARELDHRAAPRRSRAAARMISATISGGMCSVRSAIDASACAPALRRGRDERRVPARLRAAARASPRRSRACPRARGRRRPAAGRRERDDRPRAPARRELQRDVPPSELPTMCAVSEPASSIAPLDRVGHRVRRHSAGQRRAAEVAGERRREHLEVGARAAAAPAPTRARSR